MRHLFGMGALLCATLLAGGCTVEKVELGDFTFGCEADSDCPPGSCCGSGRVCDPCEPGAEGEGVGDVPEEPPPAEGEGEGGGEGEGEGGGGGGGEGEGEGEGEEPPVEPGPLSCSLDSDCPYEHRCAPTVGLCLLEDPCPAICEAEKQHCMPDSAADAHCGCGGFHFAPDGDQGFVDCLVDQISRGVCDPRGLASACPAPHCEPFCQGLRGRCPAAVVPACQRLCEEYMGFEPLLDCIDGRAGAGQCDVRQWPNCLGDDPGPVEPPEGRCAELCDRLVEQCDEPARDPCLQECQDNQHDEPLLSCVDWRIRAGLVDCTDQLLEECREAVDCPGGTTDLDYDRRSHCEAWVFKLPDGARGYGFRSTNAGDYDGDGRADLLTGAPMENGRASSLGFVHVLSGVDGQELDSWTGDERGWHMAPGDFLPGAAGGGDWVVVGAPGAELFGGVGLVRSMQHRGEHPFPDVRGGMSENLGVFVARGFDEDGDELPEVLAVADLTMTNQDVAIVSLLSRSGWQERSPRPVIVPGGRHVSPRCFEARCDVTGDGVTDLLVGGDDSVFLFRGDPDEEGERLLREWKTGSGMARQPIEACTFIPDLDGDDRADVLVAGFVGRNNDCPGQETMVFSSGTGERVRCVGPDNDHSTSVAEGPDLDGDGRAEVLVGFGDAAQRLLRPGGVLALNGTLAGGRIGDPAARDVETVTIRETVKAIRESELWIPALLPVGHGLLAAVRC